MGTKDLKSYIDDAEERTDIEKSSERNSCFIVEALKLQIAPEDHHS